MGHPEFGLLMRFLGLNPVTETDRQEELGFERLVPKLSIGCPILEPAFGFKGGKTNVSSKFFSPGSAESSAVIC